MRKRGAIVVIAVLVVTGALFASTKVDFLAMISLGWEPPLGVPESSASAVTSPPPSLEGINGHPEAVGTGVDSDIVTFGPREGGCEGCPPYKYKNSLDFEVPHGSPVLAPLDMVFIGFSNRNAEYRIRSDGEVQSPYDDLELVFESASPDWPGMIVSVYHLQSSPLLLGQGGERCERVEEWGSTRLMRGRFQTAIDEFVFNDMGNSDSCEALMGRLVRRGEVIGYAGSVGDHSMASFKFKVSHTERNPTVRFGNPYLHWVQPSAFFYWKCYSPDADFPTGVLAYPFPCEGYELPPEQYDVNYKYSTTEN